MAGDPESMMALLRAVARTPGLMMNYSSLGSDIGRDRRTVSSYISGLEYAMMIRTLGNLRGSALSTSRKLRKAYPVSSALSFAFRGRDLDDRDMGPVVETAVLNELGAAHFWRRRGMEVDFVFGDRGQLAVEVKLGGSGKGRLHFAQYAREHTVEKALVVTNRDIGQGEHGGVEFRMVPAWALCAGADVGLDGK